jgi:serine/threonine protein kinase
MRELSALCRVVLPEGAHGGAEAWHGNAAARRGWQVALHIARGLHYMHSRKVMHLDLKSANILLARDGTAKIADVGLAKILTRDNTHVSMEGTFDWAAPEVGFALLVALLCPSAQCGEILLCVLWVHFVSRPCVCECTL